MKPIVGITMGDPAGIGPEIIAKALSQRVIFDICRPIVIGSLKVLQDEFKIYNADMEIKAFDDKIGRAHV